jgi:predicted HicB family RNase H-like nuclease
MSETKTEQREATSIKIKPEVWKEAKIEAIREGKTVSQLVEEAITTWINKHKRGD